MGLLGSEYVLVREGPAVANSVTYSGVNPETLNKIYNACDLLLFPTLEEGFGLPIIEAFATKPPVVSSDIEVVNEVAQNAAILVEPTVQGCLKGIKEALSSKSILVERGIRLVKQRYSFEVFEQTMANYYYSLLYK